MHLFLIINLLITSSLFGQINPLNVGEKLEYILQFNHIKMGRGYLSVEENDVLNETPVHHVTFVANTGKFADRIFKVRDRVDIWLDQDELTTLRSIKRIREGDYNKTFYTNIDYSKSIAITNNDTIPISGKVRDPYSLLFYLRTIPIDIGEVMSFTTFDRKKTTTFQVLVAGKENITTPAGDFDCIIIRPFREGESLLKNKGDMIIWFSDDERRIPVQIQIKLKFGSMLLQLDAIS